jgi:predicted O-methyltransferase YrrM
VTLIDRRVRTVLARLEGEPVRPPAVPVPPTTGRLLFALVAPRNRCAVLELGGGRGYSTIWLAAGARHLGGKVISIEREPEIASAWRKNIAEAGLAGTAELIEGDALESIPLLEDRFDLVFLDAADRYYEELFQLVRPNLAPGTLVVADNVLSRQELLAPYSRARQSDPTLESMTLPIGEGVELSVILTDLP